MGRALFIDVREGEFSTYLFGVRGGGYELEEKKSCPLSGKYDFPPGSFLGDIEDVYLSLPPGVLNFRVMNLPFSDRDRIREILPFELDGMILGGTENAVFDNVAIGSTGDVHHVLAVYVEKDILGKILEKLRPFGVDPVFVTSIGLKPLLKDFDPARLLSPGPLEDDERIALAVEEMKSPTINLRRGEFSYMREAERTRKSLRVTAVLLILVALVLLTDAVFKALATRAEIVSLRNEMRKQYLEIFPGDKNIVNELYQLKSRMKEMKEKEAVLTGVAPLEVLLRLARTDRQGAVINEVSVDGRNITIRGEAQSLTEVQALQNSLKTQFDEVNVSDSKTSAQGGMLFTITAREKRA